MHYKKDSDRKNWLLGARFTPLDATFSRGSSTLKVPNPNYDLVPHTFSSNTVTLIINGNPLLLCGLIIGFDETAVCFTAAKSF